MDCLLLELNSNAVKSTLLFYKSDISLALHKCTTATDVPNTSVACQEIASIKCELTTLRNAVSAICTPTTTAPSPSPTHVNTTRPVSLNKLVITSWNCRGYKTAIPYINHMIQNGSDVIALSEHWMWPLAPGS